MVIIQQYQSFLKKYSYLPYFIVCGGEPLLNLDLIPLLDEIKRTFPNTPIAVLTNGTLFNELNVKRFSHYSDLEFQISIDGPDRDSHDAIRGSGSFEKTLLGIELLNSKKIKFSVQSVLSYKTSQKIREFFNFANTHNISAMNFTRLIAKGYGEKFVNSGEDRPLLPQELKRVFEEILTTSLEFNIKSGVHSPLFSLIDKRLGVKTARRWKSIVVDYQGNLCASSRSRIKLGNILTEGLEKIILTNPLLNNLRKGHIKTCGACPYIGSCGGDRNAAFAEYGDYLAKDPGCWL